MQTFLPYPNFDNSANVLDYRRLGKQRVEASQILDIVSKANSTSRWKNHPAVLMWEGFSIALAEYGIAICKEWIYRGYKDNLLPRFETYLKISKAGKTTYPFWLGIDKFHAAHRAALLAKDYEWYSKFGWSEKAEINYYWPIRK